MNQDPFIESSSAKRLRQYVLPEFRRMGIGRRLVHRILQDSRVHIAVFRLRSLDDGAVEFFENIGFTRVDGREAVTHEMKIKIVKEPKQL